MTDPKTLHYFCRFDPNTGAKLAGYIQEYQTLPSDCTEVSYEDFMKLLGSGYKYNWDSRTVVEADPLDDMSIEELKDVAYAKISQAVKSRIAEGFTAKIDAGYFHFDCTVEDELNYIMAFQAAMLDSDFTTVVRAVKDSTDVKKEVTVNSDDIRSIVLAMRDAIQSVRELGFNNKTYISAGTRSIEEVREYLRDFESSGGTLREY